MKVFKLWYDIPHMVSKKSESKKTTKKKVGRPTKFTVKLVNDICERVSAGESLRNICRDIDEKMPTRRNVHKWLLRGTAEKDDPKSEYAKFRHQYEDAMDMRADLMFEELEDIADDGSNDWMEKEGKDGSSFTVLDHEHVQRSRLRIDTRKWILSRMKPKKYNDKHVHVTEDEEGNQKAITGNAITFVSQDGD